MCNCKIKCLMKCSMYKYIELIGLFGIVWGIVEKMNV